MKKNTLFRLKNKIIQTRIKLVKSKFFFEINKQYTESGLLRVLNRMKQNNIETHKRATKKRNIDTKYSASFNRFVIKNNV